jgi:hypothetical protein
MSDGVIFAIYSAYALVFPKRGAYIHDHGQFPNYFFSHCKINKVNRITTPMVVSSTSSINMVH